MLPIISFNITIAPLTFHQWNPECNRWCCPSLRRPLYRLCPIWDIRHEDKLRQDGLRHGRDLDNPYLEHTVYVMNIIKEVKTNEK